MNAVFLHRLPDGRMAELRDLVAADATLYPDFDAALTLGDRRLRFFGGIARMSPAQIDRLTRYDPGQAAVIIATEIGSGRMLGVSRLHRTEGCQGEFAILVRSDLNGQGLGHALMRAVMARARPLGIHCVVGLVLAENTRMLGFCRDLGFTIERMAEEPDILLARYSPPSPALAA